MVTSRIHPIGLLIVLMMCSAALGAEVKITFKVTPPAGTPSDSKLFIAGDAEALGGWKEDGVEIEKGEDGSYQVVVMLIKDKPVEYKITRGSWATVEKNADGSEMANRTLTPTRDATVEIKVAAWADKAGGEAPAEKKSTRSGDIRTHAGFASKELKNSRDVLVWLPAGYERQSDRRYPVLYMHDGQNVFDAATSFAGEWGADETAGRLIEEKKIEPIIIVAIANTKDRINEYTLTPDTIASSRAVGGSGAAYMRFVCDDVKPFIDATYRTKTDRASTGVAGSSLGGTISLEICRSRPEMFGKCAAMSPALWWDRSRLVQEIEAKPEWLKQCRVWIDVGTEEGAEAGRYVDSVRAMGEILRKTGGEAGKDYVVKTIEGGHHNEADWARRFDQVLMFLFPAI